MTEPLCWRLQRLCGGKQRPLVRSALRVFVSRTALAAAARRHLLERELDKLSPDGLEVLAHARPQVHERSAELLRERRRAVDPCQGPRSLRRWEARNCSPSGRSTPSLPASSCRRTRCSLCASRSFGPTGGGTGGGTTDNRVRPGFPPVKFLAGGKHQTSPQLARSPFRFGADNCAVLICSCWSCVGAPLTLWLPLLSQEVHFRSRRRDV